MAKKKKNDLAVILPTKWSELTPAQVARVAKYLDSQGDPTEQLIMLAADLSGLMPRDVSVREDGSMVYIFYHRQKGNILLDSEQIAALASTLGWMNSEVGLMRAPELDGCTTPDYRLYGVTVEQFLTADTAYNHHCATKSPEALRVMAAALYPRRRFSSDTLQAESKRMARLDIHLSGVLLWFTGVKKFLADKYTYIFSAGESGGDAPSGADVLLSLLSGINGGDVTKNDKIKSSEIHEVLHELNLKIKQSKKDG